MGIHAGSSRNGAQISKFAMDGDRRRLHRELTEAMREQGPDVPCLNVSGAYAPDWTAADPEGQWEAAQLCRGCPVLEQCRAYGLLFSESEGVYGGLTRGQRSKYSNEYRQQVEAEAAAATEQAAAAAAAQQQTGQDIDHDSSSNARELAAADIEGEQLRARNSARRARRELRTGETGSPEINRGTLRSRKNPPTAGRRMKTNQQQAETAALAAAQPFRRTDRPEPYPPPGESNLRPNRNTQPGGGV